MIVTIVLALPDRHRAVRVEVTPGATVGEAIAASRLLQLEPELRGRALETGVWNRRCSLDEPVRDGDRIEVYRPLTVDPKEARRVRAAVRRRRGKAA
jgi:hypothetical protein